MVATGNRASTASAEEVARRLLAWYDQHRRDLPWRRTRDPYAIWVSEMMLQQTRVATVLDYYERWMRRFPTLHALASAQDDDVLYAWQGLGYYRRARSLLAGARAVVQRHDGRLPRQAATLRELPGIGPYSAGAIASIAFGERAPVVDGNVARVLSRLFALRGAPTRGALHKQLWKLATDLVPAERPGDFNQALMELGATVCNAREPRCEACPLAGACLARARGIAQDLPEPAERPATTRVHMVAAVARQSGRLLVVRLPASAPRWAGMWQFPTATPSVRETPEHAVRRALAEHIGAGGDAIVRGLVTVVRHSVTRFAITLDAYACDAPRGRLRSVACDSFAWKRPTELRELALPAAHRKIAERLAQ